MSSAQWHEIGSIRRAAVIPWVDVVDVASLSPTGTARKATGPVARDEEGAQIVRYPVRRPTAIEQVAAAGMRDEATEGQGSPWVGQELEQGLCRDWLGGATRHGHGGRSLVEPEQGRQAHGDLQGDAGRLSRGPQVVARFRVSADGLDESC